jgi:hypothetical protein
MNMASWDDAFLIFDKWRDDPGPPLISVLRPVQLHGDTILNGGTGFVRAVDPHRGIVLVEMDAEIEEIDLSGASFEYSDPRSSPLVDGKWECSLEARFPDGSMILFAQKTELPFSE